MRTTLLVANGIEAGFYKNALTAMSENLGIENPVDIVESRDEWDRATNTFRIGAGVKGGDAIWPTAAEVNKSPELKGTIWNSFQREVVPATKSRVSASLHFTRDDVIKIMKLMSAAASPFTFVNAEGEEILVSNKASGPGQISFGDLASQLAATWLHGATAIKIVEKQ